MKKWKVKLVELSAEKADGSRNTVREDIIATCESHGSAELITYLLRNNSSYKDLLEENKDGKNADRCMYLLVCGQ